MMEWQVEILRSERCTMSLEVLANGTVRIRAPRRLPQREIDRFLAQKADWIAARLARIRRADAAPLTPEDIRRLTEQARAEIPPQVAVHAAAMGVTYGTITIRHQKSRWGSCTAVGNLNFNCLLMLAPPSVTEYVIVHELCHRIVPDHSTRFWATVERFLPDYRASRRWLRENGAAIVCRMENG